MEELTYEEKLKLENTKEHLRIVQENLRIANSKLEESLAVRKEEDIKLENVKAESARILQESALTLQTIKERTVQLDNREASVTERENKITLSEEINVKEIEKAQAKLKEIEASGVAKLTEKKVELEQATSDFNRAIELYSHYSLLAEEKNKELTLVLETIHKENIELELLITQRKEEEVYFSKFKEDAEKEKKEIQLLIESEKEKIEAPMQLLLVTEDRVDRKLRNAELLRARIQTTFDENYPGVEAKL